MQTIDPAPAPSGPERASAVHHRDRRPARALSPRSARPCRTRCRSCLSTAGWGSVLEFLDVIEPLSRDFHLVIPRFPGFGLSGPTMPCGWDAHRADEQAGLSALRHARRRLPFRHHPGHGRGHARTHGGRARELPAHATPPRASNCPKNVQSGPLTLADLDRDVAWRGVVQRQVLGNRCGSRPRRGCTGLISSQQRSAGSGRCSPGPGWAPADCRTLLTGILPDPRDPEHKGADWFGHSGLCW